MNRMHRKRLMISLRQSVLRILPIQRRDHGRKLPAAKHLAPRKARQAACATRVAAFCPGQNFPR